MQGVTEGQRGRLSETESLRKFWGFGYLIAVLGGATLAVIFGLMAGLSAGVTLMMMGGGAILLAGILFTILEVLRLGRGPQSAPPR